MISEQLRGARVALQEHELGSKWLGQEKREKGKREREKEGEDRINRDRKVRQKRWHVGTRGVVGFKGWEGYNISERRQGARLLATGKLIKFLKAGRKGQVGRPTGQDSCAQLVGIL